MCSYLGQSQTKGALMLLPLISPDFTFLSVSNDSVSTTDILLEKW